jgi:uncharacterized protein (DUF2062 family)
VALAFGIGLFIAFFPLLGIHTGLALVIALTFRLSRVALLAGAWVNNPWTLAPMYTAGTLVGCALLGVLVGLLAYLVLRLILERRRPALQTGDVR